MAALTLPGPSLVRESIRPLTGPVIGTPGTVGTVDPIEPAGSSVASQSVEESAEARRAGTIESFVRYYGEAARNPLEYIEQSWADEEWTRGCYAGYFPPGVWLDYGEALRAPIGRLHWAGTETAEVWNGYFDGAVRSGERAADEVRALAG